MTSAWVGELVRPRGVEPEDWETCHRFDDNTGDMRGPTGSTRCDPLPHNGNGRGRRR